MAHDEQGSVRPWPVVASEQGTDYRIFRARHDLLRSPRSGAEHRMVVLQTPDWVNVIPVTPEGQVVLVRQLRHGIRSVTLEIPGGMVDAGEQPEQAARRELLEETGYRPSRLEWLGVVHPNPAFQDNRCHTFLAHDCELVAEPAGDASEDIVVELWPVDLLGDMVTTGVITHALVINALYWFLFERQRKQASGATQAARENR